jgi:YHS domain-containing protein
LTECRRVPRPGGVLCFTVPIVVGRLSRRREGLAKSFHGTATDTPDAAPEHMAAAKTATDPSCGMPVDPAKAAAAGNTLAYRGATYYFCSKECKLKFQNNLAASAGTRQ